MFVPTWRYGKDGAAAIAYSREELERFEAQGWADHPDKVGAAPVEAVAPVETAKTPEAPAVPTLEVLEAMSRLELDEYAKKYGIELDRRKSKSNMVADFIAALSAKE